MTPQDMILAMTQDARNEFTLVRSQYSNTWYCTLTLIRADSTVRFEERDSAFEAVILNIHYKYLELVSAIPRYSAPTIDQPPTVPIPSAPPLSDDIPF